MLSQSDLCTGQLLNIGGVHTKAGGSLRGISSLLGQSQYLLHVKTAFSLGL